MPHVSSIIHARDTQKQRNMLAVITMERILKVNELDIIFYITNYHQQQ